MVILVTKYELIAKQQQKEFLWGKYFLILATVILNNSTERFRTFSTSSNILHYKYNLEMSAVYLHNSWKYIICKPWLIHGLLSQSVKVRYCLQAWRGQEEDRKPVGKKKKRGTCKPNKVAICWKFPKRLCLGSCWMLQRIFWQINKQKK